MTHYWGVIVPMAEAAGIYPWLCVTAFKGDIFDLDISILRTEFFSDVIAKKLYDNNCDNDTLILAEQKVEYLKSKKLTTI